VNAYIASQIDKEKLYDVIYKSRNWRDHLVLFTCCSCFFLCVCERYISVQWCVWDYAFVYILTTRNRKSLLLFLTKTTTMVRHWKS